MRLALGAFLSVDNKLCLFIFKVNSFLNAPSLLFVEQWFMY